jgi:hypothetical protein
MESYIQVLLCFILKNEINISFEDYLSEVEKQVVLLEFEKNGLPPDGYSISVKPTGAVVKRQISKKNDKALDDVVVRADIPVKKGKNLFDDVL